MRGYLDITGEGGLVKLGDLIDAIDALRAEAAAVGLGERYERIEVSVNTKDGVTHHALTALRIRLPVQTPPSREVRDGS